MTTHREMTATLTHEEALVVHSCATCAVLYAVTADFEEHRRRDGATFYCPGGHPMVFRGSAMEQLRDQAEQAREEARQWRRRYEAARKEKERIENDLLDAVKETMRLEKRIQAGTCPHCRRHFVNLGRHMKSKHRDQVRDSATR